MENNIINFTLLTFAQALVQLVKSHLDSWHFQRSFTRDFLLYVKEQKRSPFASKSPPPAFPAFFSCLGKLRLDLKGFHMRYRISVLRVQSSICSLQMSHGHKFFFVLIGVSLQAKKASISLLYDTAISTAPN